MRLGHDLLFDVLFIYQFDIFWSESQTIFYQIQANIKEVFQKKK